MAIVEYFRRALEPKPKARFPKKTIYIWPDPMSDSLLNEKGIRQYFGELELRNG